MNGEQWFSFWLLVAELSVRPRGTWPPVCINKHVFNGFMVSFFLPDSNSVDLIISAVFRFSHEKRYFLSRDPSPSTTVLQYNSHHYGAITRLSFYSKYLANRDLYIELGICKQSPLYNNIHVLQSYATDYRLLTLWLQDSTCRIFDHIWRVRHPLRKMHGLLPAPWTRQNRPGNSC